MFPFSKSPVPAATRRSLSAFRTIVARRTVATSADRLVTCVHDVQPMHATKELTKVVRTIATGNKPTETVSKKLASPPLRTA